MCLQPQKLLKSFFPPKWLGWILKFLPFLRSMLCMPHSPICRPALWIQVVRCVLNMCESALLRAHKEVTVKCSDWLPRLGTRNERTRSCSPGHLSFRVSPRPPPPHPETTCFLECGFILHPMANAVIRAVSSVKGLKQEQRHLFLGTLGQCLAPYQVLVLLVVLIFHTQNAKGGSLPRGRRATRWKSRV